MFTKVEIGDCTLYHGDCREVLPKIRGVKATLTDPPYNVGFAYDEHDDRMPEDLYLPWLAEVFGLCAAAGSQSLMWFWQGIRVAKGEARAVLPAGFWIHHLAAWFKKEFAGDLWKGGHPAYSWEPIIWATCDPGLTYGGPKGGHAGRDCLIGNSSRHDKAAIGHPCPKTASVVKSAAGWLQADVILDPFMGSGTVGEACVKLGKRFIGIEKSPAYFDVAVKRIEAVSGKGSLFEESASA